MPSDEDVRRLKLASGDAWSRVSVEKRDLAYDETRLLEARAEIHLRELRGERDTPRLSRLKARADAYERPSELRMQRLAQSLADAKQAMRRWIDAEETDDA